MVELHHRLLRANFHHEPLASILKQDYLAFYRSILYTVTASYENVQNNCTILTMPGKFCHTIGATLPVYNTVLKSITADYLIIANLAIINLLLWD